MPVHASMAAARFMLYFFQGLRVRSVTLGFARRVGGVQRHSRVRTSNVRLSRTPTLAGPPIAGPSNPLSTLHNQSCDCLIKGAPI